MHGLHVASHAVGWKQPGNKSIWDWVTCTGYCIIKSRLETGLAILKMWPEDDRDLLKPNFESELAFRVKKRPSGWHVAAYMQEVQVDL